MALMQVNKNPSLRDLRVFGLLLPVFFGLVGWTIDAPSTARIVWGAGLALTAVYFAAPPARRPIFLGWSYATYPIGWTVSHLIMAAVFFLAITPVAMLLRLLGRDSMERKLDRNAKSYWVVRSPSDGVQRYFRQF